MVMSILSRETGIYKNKELGWNDMVKGTKVRVREISSGMEFEGIRFSHSMVGLVGSIVTIKKIFTWNDHKSPHRCVIVTEENGTMSQFIWHPSMFEPIY